MELEQPLYTRDDRKQAALRLFLNHLELYGVHETFFQKVKQHEGLKAESELREIYNVYVCPLKRRS